MMRSVCAALALIFAIGTAQAQNFSAEELASRTVHRRAVEAVIWGMPAVNFDLMSQAMTEAKGSWNQIVFWSRLPDWKNQTLTPNPDMIYLMPFFDTKDAGPMVMEIPPAVRRFDHRQHRRRLADRAGGCRSRRRRQGQGRQISDPAAWL